MSDNMSRVAADRGFHRHTEFLDFAACEAQADCRIHALLFAIRIPTKQTLFFLDGFSLVNATRALLKRALAIFSCYSI